jgi:hypothetical protein
MPKMLRDTEKDYGKPGCPNDPRSQVLAHGDEVIERVDFRNWQILLQKSKVASVRIFGETLKREAIDDSDNLNRVTEVA